VGGTDFNWCPMTSTAACPTGPYWNASNNANQASAVGYVPEMPWNDTCTNPFALQFLIGIALELQVGGVNNTEEACNLISNNAQELDQEDPILLDLVDTVGGSGGASNCTVSDGLTEASCADGYTKPSWQTGVSGIPSDGKRDLPDVSFFSSDGFLTDSAYLICVEESGGEPCTYSTDAEPFASEVGGTSASTPPMAGVMALINQKAGAPQGFANPELYKLAAQQSYSSCSAETVTTSSTCYFNDIDAGSFPTAGTNAMPCDKGYNGSNSPDCTENNSLQGQTDEVGILNGYSATVGYDQATGLGSLNVANVVNAWPATSGGSGVTVTVTPASTSLILTQTLAVTGTVASAASGGATPTGTVMLTAGSYTSKATLASGAYSFTVPANSLGAGTDTLYVAYSGSTAYSTGSGEAVVTVLGTGATFSLNSPAPVVTPSGGVAAGSTASAVVTVAGVDGYAGTVTVTCSLTTSPSGASDAPTCTGGGPTLAVTLPNTTTQTLTFSVSTTAPSTTTIQELKKHHTASNNGRWIGAGSGALLSLLVFFGIPARRRSWRSMLGMLLLMAGLGSLAGCGGGGGPTTTTITDPGTTAGSYVFTVTGVGNPSVSPAVSETFTVVVN
jgi:hypothetical protein